MISKRNKQLYETIMRKVSKIIKQKLNESWDDDDYYYPDGLMELDPKDMFFDDELDERDPEMYERILTDLDIPLEGYKYDMIKVYTDGKDVTDDSELVDALNCIQNEEDRKYFETLANNTIERYIKNGIIDWEANIPQYDDDLTDYYRERQRDF